MEGNKYHKPAGYHVPEVAPTPVYKLSVQERWALMLKGHEGIPANPPVLQFPRLDDEKRSSP